MARTIDIESRIAALSPAMRKLLRQRLGRADPGDVFTMSISRRPDPDVAPLSYSQERVWFLSRMEPENPVTNRPFALRHRGPLETGILERVLNKIMERHEILRATVAEREGIPVQNIAPALSVRLPVKDFSKIPLSEKFDHVGAFAGEETRKPFDLSIGPLLRATLLRLDAQDHILLVVVHHILFDGWSAKVFTREIETLYTDFIANRTPSLPNLPIQYADYAHWQRVGFDSGRMTPHLAYWKEALDNAPPELLLPEDRPRAGAVTWGGVQRSCPLSPALTESLRRIGNRDGATLFMVLLAAFNVLLYRYSNQEDIVLGAPVAGRIAPETENLIGFFVNTLVLRNDLSGNPSFRQFLGRVKQTCIDAISYQDAPFEKVVEVLNTGRDMHRSPLFQVLFNFENLSRQEEGAQSSTWEEFEFDPEVASFDLDLEITEKHGEFFCKLTVNRALFNAETAQRMLGHYETLLAGIAETPDRLLSDLPLMTEPECFRILVEWNATKASYPQDKCIHQLFEEQAARNPDSVAVTFGGSHLTYGELNVRANRLAHHLIHLGVSPDQLVAVGMERSIELIVGLLAILKAGGAYVPLDPEYPDDRLAHMLNDCAPAALITQERLKERWNRFASGIPVIELDGGAGLWSDCSIVNPDPVDLGLASHHLAYVIYTSGSTGTPKGVMIEHRSIVNHTIWQCGAFAFDANDAILQRTPLSFDAAMWEIWSPLSIGARVVLPKDSLEAKDPSALAELIQTGKISVVQFVPSLLRQFALRQVVFPCCYIFCGGESLGLDLVEWALPLSTHGLVNLYGPTEATIVATSWIVPRNVAGMEAVPIGRPIANTRIYILDSHGQPVPAGVSGEIYVGGAGWPGDT